MLAKLWGIWRHGFALAFVYGLGLVLGFFYLAIPAFILNALLGLGGWGMDEERLYWLLLGLFFIWAPLGLGMAARYSSSDELKPEDYPRRDPFGVRRMTEQ